MRELEQGFQSLELKLNTVPCSRGDFAFTTITFGQWNPELFTEEEREWLMTISRIMLQVRRNGHGKDGKPVVFPKLVYLYDERQIEADKWSAQLFDEAVRTSSECMYPDYLSLSSENGSVSEIFQQYGAITSPMGCRAFLSLWCNEEGRAVTVGRCNIGAVSLNLPIILKLASSVIPTPGAMTSGAFSTSVSNSSAPSLRSATTSSATRSARATRSPSRRAASTRARRAPTTAWATSCAT